MASNAPLAQMIQLIVLTCCALGAVYFVFYRPTVNAQQRQRRVIAGLRQGDEIVTTAGFIARIADIREPDDGPVELMLDLGDGRLIRARTSAVAERLPRPDEIEAGVPKDAQTITETGIPSSLQGRGAGG